MVYKYKRSTRRQRWSKISREKALEVIVFSEMGYRFAPSQPNVPHTTLERYVTQQKNYLTESILETSLNKTELKKYRGSFRKRI